MRKRRVLIAGLSAVLLASPALAERRSQVVRAEPGASIRLYDSLCDEDNSLECMIAEIGCARPGDFTASVFDLQSKEASTVFAKNNGKASLAAGGQNFELQITKVSLSEYTYHWNVTAMRFERPREVWGAIWGAAEIQLAAGARKATIRRDEIDEGGLRHVVSTCAAASQ